VSATDGFDTEVDYITINPAVKAGHYNVVIMKYSHIDGGEFTVFRCSEQLRQPAAEALAKSWQAATKLEILP